jgi:hypothetical protein
LRDVIEQSLPPVVDEAAASVGEGGRSRLAAPEKQLFDNDAADKPDRLCFCDALLKCFYTDMLE